MTLDAVLALVVAFMINLTVISCFAELFYNKSMRFHSLRLTSLTACLDHSMTACLNLDLIDSSSHEEQVVCYDDRHVKSTSYPTS